MPFNANAERFIADQRRYFKGAFEGFAAFGGPCVYFHRECLRAGEEEFLSKRHVEMLYATLTAWGMHRMGDAGRARTRLIDWDRFHDSLTKQGARLRRFRRHRMLTMSEEQYSKAISGLRPCYEALEVSVSNATVVANSKTLHHLLPGLVPPIDRHYTIRFLREPPAKWRAAAGGFRTVPLPTGRHDQFTVFQDACIALKRLADRVEPAIFRDEHRRHGVDAPKALDNAIVNFVRILAAEGK